MQPAGEWNVKGIDIDAVTHPLHPLAIHGCNNSAELRDGTGRRVTSGYPLRVQKHQLLCPVSTGISSCTVAMRRTLSAEVDHKLHRSDIGLVDRGRDGRWHGIRLRLRLILALGQKGGGKEKCNCQKA